MGPTSSEIGETYEELPDVSFLATEYPMKVHDAFRAQAPGRRLASATEVAIRLANQDQYPNRQDIHLTSTCSMYWQDGEFAHVAFADVENNPLEELFADPGFDPASQTGFYNVPKSSVQSHIEAALADRRNVVLDDHELTMTNVQGTEFWRNDAGAGFLTAIFGYDIADLVHKTTRLKLTPSETGSGETAFRRGAWKISYKDHATVKANVPEDMVRLGGVRFIGKSARWVSDYSRVLLLSYPSAEQGNAHYVQRLPEY